MSTGGHFVPFDFMYIVAVYQARKQVRAGMMTKREYRVIRDELKQYSEQWYTLSGDTPRTKPWRTQYTRKQVVKHLQKARII